ncbi:MAG: hypothetical protein OEZ43_01425 [Gammaproteobacteria bacterium]|nr:hypothetical protein [Gammaproteobacteria bacterium]
MNIGLKIVFFLLLLVGYLLVVKLLARRFQWHPELSRKAVHIGMGCVTLSFPFVFSQAWAVAVLTGISAILLFLIKKLPILQRNLGSALHGVKRDSYGDFYFPLAVAASFYLAKGDTTLYMIPILILTFADAMAALIGVFLGETRFKTSVGEKTVEGSLAFLFTAFLCSFCYLVIFTDFDVYTSLLASTLLGIVIMLVEAFSWDGIDNLFVPIGSLFLIREYLHLSHETLTQHIGILLLLLLGLLWWRRWSTLRNEAILLASVFGYVVWALADWRWLLVALVTILSYPLLTPAREDIQQRIHGMSAIISVTATGTFWLYFFRILEYPTLFFLFSLGFATHLSIILFVRHLRIRPRLHRGILAIICATKSGILIMGLYLVLDWQKDTASLFYTLISFPLIFLATWMFSMDQTNIDEAPADKDRWLRQSTIVGLATIVGITPLVLF